MNTQDYRIHGLSSIFSDNELLNLKEDQGHVISILSYFATSLFGKNNVDDVLWSICENCISSLNLEDCVIYLYDQNCQHLVQRAAYGAKDKGGRKILSPITIRLGEGIVGTTAANGQAEIVNDVAKDPRYIVDDKHRQSEMSVPLIHGDALVGVIDLEHSERDFFTKEHLKLMKLIAHLTVQKLAHLGKKSNFTDDNAYFKAFRTLVEEKHIYKNPNLSLSGIAEELNISANYLSQIINKLTDKSFPDLINSYRVQEAAKLLQDPKYNHFTITGIGLESGFNSKSSFYTAFKKIMNVAPSEYRKSPETGGSDSSTE